MIFKFNLFRQLQAWSSDYTPLWISFSPRRKRQLLALLLLSLLSAVAEVGNLGALMPFLKLLADPAEGLSVLGSWAAPLMGLDRTQLLLLLGICFLVMVALSAALRTMAIRGQLKLTALLGADMGRQVLRDVLHRPYVWHLQQNSSSVLTLLNKDVYTMVGTIQGVLGLIVNGLIALLLTAALVALAPGVMLVVALLLAAFYWLVYCFTRGSLARDGRIETQQYAASVQTVQESLGGIRDLLLDRTQDFYLNRFDDHYRQYRLAGYRINFKAQAPRYLIESFAMALIAGVALALALQGNGISQVLPLLGTLALGAYRLLQPAQQCFNTFSSLKANQAAWANLRPHFLTHSSYSTQGFPLPRSGSAPAVELQQVSFRYGSQNPWVVQDLSLSIPAGSRVAFVGSTGSGKSTTTDLLLGLLKPEQGRILVDGRDLHATIGQLEQWQQNLAHVPQQIYLSDGSIAENIAFGTKPHEIDMVRVRTAACRARLDDLIDQLPHGYSTIVGERGIRLSGGQRQRIGIARALYREASLLILDEATSALDNRTEAQVMNALVELEQPMTVVMIAHRLSTVRNCDTIFLFKQGSLLAKGTYDELCRNSSEFRCLALSSEQLSA